MSSAAAATSAGVRLLAASALIVLALTACGGSDGDAETSQAAPAVTGTGVGQNEPLEGPTWTLVDGSALGIAIEGVTVTARFEEGTLSGHSGCNSYQAIYEVDGSALSIPPDITGTLKACPDPEGAVESRYLELLSKVASYSTDANTLALYDSQGQPLLGFAVIDSSEAIVGEWIVTGYYTGSAVTSVLGGVTLTANFGPSTVTGNGGCNTFNGPYKVDGNSLRIGPLASTRAACPSEELEQQEEAYLAALQLATSYKVTADRLDLLRPGETYAVTLVRG